MSALVNFVLIETARTADLDLGITAVLWEYIINNNCLRTSKHQPTSPSIAVCSTDLSPKTLLQTCKRLSIPQRNLIDGYSQWYPLNLSDSTTPFRTVHIASVESTDGTESTEQFDALADIINAVSNALNHTPESDVNERVVVFDSLTSILRYHPFLSTFIRLRDALNRSVKRPIETPLTFLCTIRRDETGQALTNSLARYADTYILAYQPNMGHSQLRNSVCMNLRRRKPSGRVVFQKIDATLDRTHGYCQLADVRVVTENDPVSVKNGSDAKTSDPSLELAQRGLTFRIGLSSKEREMRAAAGLPYLHQDEALADSALELHPKHLQVSQASFNELNPANDDGDDDGDDDIEIDDEGELFSEDV